MRQKGFVPVLALMALVVVVAVSYIGYKYFKTNPSSTPTVTPTPTPNWKTYVNEDYKVSFQYPSDFTKEALPLSKEISNNGKVKLIQDIYSDSIQVRLSIYSMDSTDIQGWIKIHSPHPENKFNPENPNYYYANISDIRETTFNNYPSLTFATYAYESGTKSTEIVILHNNYIYELGTTNTAQSNSNKYIEKESIANQILSTFKFTQ